MPKKILLISSGQPSLNPRLVKEADALCYAGYEVTVLYAYWNKWGTAHDKVLLARKAWKAIRVGGSPKYGRIIFFLSKLMSSLSKLTIKKTRFKNLADHAISRSSYFLTREAKKHNADLYIAHNIGALPALIKAAKANNKPCGFDAEDLHRYEISSDPSHPDVLLKSYIENKYLPQLQYLTVSSEAIGAAYRKLFPGLLPKVVRNVFPKSNLKPRYLINRLVPVRLFWFSQILGEQRGLQDVAKALAQLPRQNYELHLLCDRPAYTLAFRDELVASGIDIRFYDPLPSDELVTFAAQFDIGLATEPGFSINNDLALSNKLFTYLQAGLFMVATATTAQKAFFEQYPDVGLLYQPGNVSVLVEILKLLENNRQTISDGQRASLVLAHTEMNWETEKHLFLETISQAIKTDEALIDY
jgi:hypothetical protein